MARHRIERRDFLKRASTLAAAAAAFRVGGTDLLALPQRRAATVPPAAAAGPRKFSLAHLTVLGCAPPEMTYIAARAGYDYVSFRLIYMGLAGETNYDLASTRTCCGRRRQRWRPRA